MINKNKIILSSIIVTIICLTLNVKAITLTTDSTKQGTTDTNSYLVTNTGSLTITNIKSESKGMEDFAAVKILDVFYNPTTNVVTYEFTSSFQTFLDNNSTYKSLTVDDYLKLTSGDITTGSVVTNSTADVLLSKYVTARDSDITNSTLTCKISSGECKFTELVAGAYLVRPKKYSDRNYAVMLGNVTPVNNAGVWVIDTPSIVAKESTAYSMKVYVNSVGNTTGVFGKGSKLTLITDINIPEISNMEENEYIDIDYNHNSNYYLLNHVALPGEGEIECNSNSSIISFCSDVPKIQLNGENLIVQPDGFVTDSSNTIIAEISGGYIYFYLDYLEKSKSKNIHIEHILTHDRGAGDVDLTKTNEISLRLYDRLNGRVIVTSNNITLYTYNLEILAYEKGDKTKLLSGLTFDVYSDEALTNKIDTITTDDKGTTGIDRLGEGTFYLKQTKTKTGYSLLKPFSITLDSTNSQPNETTTFEIQIPKAGILPVTGGSGIFIYIILGLAIIVGAVVGFIYYNKKKEKNNNKEKEEN